MSVTGWVSAQIWPNTECLGGDLGYWRQQRRKLQSHQECRTRHFGAFSFWRFSEGAGFGERDGVRGGWVFPDHPGVSWRFQLNTVL